MMTSQITIPQNLGDVRDIRKFTTLVFFTLSLGLLSPPNPSFSGICKVRKFSLNLSMKCWNSVQNAETQYEMLKLCMKCWISAFNAQGWWGIIVAVQVGAVKIYVAAVEVRAQEKRKTGWNSGTIKIDGFLSFTPCWMLMYFFAGVFLNLTLCMTKLRVLVLSFPDFMDISITLHYILELTISLFLFCIRIHHRQNERTNVQVAMRLCVIDSKL
jgi:hypothetical protein